MKCSYLLAAGAIALFGAACNGQKSDKVPQGQLSSKIIHNPRSAEGINQAEVKELPVLIFTDTAHDFGAMQAGERVEHEFTFKNEGKSPLIISGTSTSCGCTVADFSREPIAPGKTGTMKVAFSSAGKQGHMLKSIIVSSNAYPTVRILTITADVKPESAR